jgi:hypothetical protein
VQIVILRFIFKFLNNVRSGNTRKPFAASESWTANSLFTVQKSKHETCTQLWLCQLRNLGINSVFWMTECATSIQSCSSCQRNLLANHYEKTYLSGGILRLSTHVCPVQAQHSPHVLIPSCSIHLEQHLKAPARVFIHSTPVNSRLRFRLRVT